jgi:hypothetical protein
MRSRQKLIYSAFLLVFLIVVAHQRVVNYDLQCQIDTLNLDITVLQLTIDRHLETIKQKDSVIDFHNMTIRYYQNQTRKYKQQASERILDGQSYTIPSAMTDACDTTEEYI